MSYYHREALQALEAFILEKAPKHHAVVGGGFDSWPDLQAWGKANILGVDSLPVSADNCDRTVYTSARVNRAFRAWHDALHLHYGLDFTYAGEMFTAQKHIEAMTGQLGFFEENAKAILWADTAGQSEYFRIHGEFPVDQRAFVLAYTRRGGAAIFEGKY